MKRVSILLSASLVLGLSSGYGLAADPIVVDFEDENIDAWEIVDEDPENLGDLGPSLWEIRESELGFDDNVLFQGSNIWGDAEDHMLMGTIAYYNEQQFTNFRLDVDVIAEDNDGMGFVWGYQSLEKHSRFQLMNDRWPEVPTVDGFNGPYLISHTRVSNESPWYEVLEVLEADEYIPYTQGFEEINHWTLEMVDGNFTITTTDSFGDENVLTGVDPTYTGGYVGIQLYAQNNVEFDNFVITPLDAGLTGDFNGNDGLDVDDIELLNAEIRAATNGAGFDLDGDGLVNTADQVEWVTNVAGTWYGDANLDGEFNSSDFVQVFSAGKFETGEAATWADGDWNGDGRFDSGDFVTAFSDGGFEIGIRTPNVPEPTNAAVTLVVSLFALLGLGRYRS